MVRYVYDFAEGSRDLADLLGGKGANLAEMTRLGLPVPPGFTVTTEACRAYLATGAEPDGLAGEVADHLTALEDAARPAARRPARPAAAVRAFRGPVLHARHDGDDPRHRPRTTQPSSAWPRPAGNERFAWDSYRRLHADVRRHRHAASPGDVFDKALADLKRDRGAANDLTSTPTTCRARRRRTRS